jgi:hypothetical protein
MHKTTILTGINDVSRQRESPTTKPLHAAALDFSSKNNQMAASFHLPAAA